MQTKELPEKLAKYPSTEKYRIVDTVGVPHPYCIGADHLRLNAGMYLNIPAVEEKGARCDICKQGNRKYGERILPFDEHKLALLVEVNDTRELNKMPELHAYLLSIKAQAEADGYVGFAFVKAKEVK
jgi:hypothetical protein